MSPSSAARLLARITFGLVAALTVLSAPRSAAQDAPPPGAAPDLSPMDQLLAPIALYPDPLIALILPASTFPDDLGAAANYLNANGDPNQVDSQPWNDAVKGLAHYPDVVKWMVNNPDWTQQLGSAFANQPGDVMSSVQSLRQRAKAAGTLTSTPEQQIVADGDEIDIEPAQADVMYVPRYDPEVVYMAPPVGYYGGPFFTFGSPYAMGAWLSFDLDWRRRGIITGDWYHWHRQYGGWHYRGTGNGFVGQPWHAPARPAFRPRVGVTTGRPLYVHPRPIIGTPPRPSYIPHGNRPPVRVNPPTPRVAHPPVGSAPAVRIAPSAPAPRPEFHRPAPVVSRPPTAPVRPAPSATRPVDHPRVAPAHPMPQHPSAPRTHPVQHAQPVQHAAPVQHSQPAHQAPPRERDQDRK